MNRCHVPCHVASDVYRFTMQSRPDPLQSLTPPLIPVLHVVKQQTKRTNFLRLLVDLDWLCTLKRHFRSCLWLPPSFVIAAIQYDIVIHLILTNGVFESMRKLQHASLLTGLTAWSLPLSSAQSSTNTKSRAMSNVTSQNTHLQDLFTSQTLYEVTKSNLAICPASGLQACSFSYLVPPRGCARLAHPARGYEHWGQMGGIWNGRHGQGELL